MPRICHFIFLRVNALITASIFVVMGSMSEPIPMANHLPVQKRVTLQGKVIASRPLTSHYRLYLCQLIQHPSIVTGAHRGIGLGITECCLANGPAKVYNIDYADEVGDDFKTIAKVYPDQLFALRADVTQEESIQRAVE